MNLKIIRLVVLSVLCLSFTKVSAQALKDDFHAEIGVAGGGSFYLGDANSIMFKNMQPAYGVFFRYKFDPRLALRVELNGTKIVWNGNTAGNQINTFEACGEFNFFDLEDNPNKRASRIFSPYIFGGPGLMNFEYDGKNIIKPAIPFGVGFKVKIADRWNIDAKWTTRVLLSDEMEGLPALNNLYHLNGSNFTNNDILSTFSIGISYDIFKKECDCKVIKNK